MAIELTLKTELSRDALMELREELDGLLGALPTTHQATTPMPSPADQTEAKVAAVWERLGEKSREYLSACAQQSEGGPFSLDDLAAVMNEDVGAVKAYHRNVARSAADVDPKDLELFEKGREGVREGERTRTVTKFRMPERVRAAILKQSGGNS